MLNSKMKEKTELINELEQKNEKNRQKIISKIKAMENYKKKYDLEKQEKLNEYKKERELKFKTCEQNKKELRLEDEQFRMSILDYDYELLNRATATENKNALKRRNASEKTIFKQMALENNLTKFNKKMNGLKDKSVYKKSPEERFKMFRDVKRAEARKKKEEEEKLLDKQ